MSGELATFATPERRAREYPAYDHDDLENVFAPVIRDLQEFLSAQLGRRAIRLEVIERAQNAFVSPIRDRALFRNATFVLEVAARRPLIEIQNQFPHLFKVGPNTKMNEIVHAHLPGVTLVHLPTPPPHIRAITDHVYFYLDRKSPLWPEFSTAGSVGMHFSGDWPDLELEFWAILEDATMSDRSRPIHSAAGIGRSSARIRVDGPRSPLPPARHRRRPASRSRAAEPGPGRLPQQPPYPGQPPAYPAQPPYPGQPPGAHPAPPPYPGQAPYPGAPQSPQYPPGAYPAPQAPPPSPGAPPPPPEPFRQPQQYAPAPATHSAEEWISTPGQPQAPAPHAMQAAPNFRVDDLVAPNSNPIMRAAGPLLVLLGRLRVALLRASFASLMEQVAAAIKFFETDVRSAGISEQQANSAKYILCATADDIVQHIPTEDRHVWTQYSMLSRFFGERVGGVRFFEILEHAKVDPLINYPLLELQHAALALGFQGVYRSSGGGVSTLQTAAAQPL